ncbi:MAG: glucose-1-phosphate thymidylyltransferase [Bacteroidales bacterium]|nr:glucose-1-phosphate thymidylyltransferase [Bacteroidales bacterium]
MKLPHITLRDPEEARINLLPMTFTRPVSEIRLGILTLREKWERLLPGSYSWETSDYLTDKYPASSTPADYIIDANIIPTPSVVADLERGAAPEADRITSLYDIFLKNGDAIETDFRLLTEGRTSQPLPDNSILIGNKSLLFIEEGASVEGVTLNTRRGPIYIGKDAEVMEGSCLRGPIAICEHATVNMGTKIYSGTTIGPWCKVGGELNNVVMFGYSNKAHDGFLGNAVIGEWCNIGAGCVASNLKNDYTEIKLWNYREQRFSRTGLQFCGLIMGDHSKAGINTMFNTATVLGVGVNIHGSGFPRNFVPSFSEGGASGFTDVSLTKFFDIASRMMARRNKELTEADRHIFQSIYDFAERYK